MNFLSFHFFYSQTDPLVSSNNRGKVLGATHDYIHSANIPQREFLLFVFVQNVETVKMLSSTKQQQDDLLRAKEQLQGELENLRQEKKNTVRPRQRPTHKPLQTPADLDVMSIESVCRLSIRWTSDSRRPNGWTKNCWSTERSSLCFVVPLKIKRWWDWKLTLNMENRTLEFSNSVVKIRITSQ